MRNKLTPGFRIPNSLFERGLQNYKMLKYLVFHIVIPLGKGHISFGDCVLPAINDGATDMFIIELLISVAQCFSTGNLNTHNQHRGFSPVNLFFPDTAIVF